MANYIGNRPADGEFKRLDSITSQFNGSLTTFNLQFNSVSQSLGDASQLIVSLNGVVQEPLGAYTLGTGGSTIIFSSAPASGDTCFIIMLGGVGGTVTGTLTDNIVSTAKIGDGAVTSAKITIDDDISFPDNDKLIFGAGSDLQIYHDGNDKIVSSSSYFILEGSNIILRNNGGTEDYAKFFGNGAVNLYHDNSLKLATTSTGIDVTGIAVADEINLDGGGDIHSTTDTGYVGIAGGTNSNVGANALFYGGSHSSLAGVTKFRSGSATNITILSDGKVGIGKTDPGTSLHVYNSTINGVATFESGDAQGGIALRDNSTTQPVYLLAVGDEFKVQTNTAERMRIDNVGRVGIGVTPTHKLDVAGTTKAEQYLLDAVAKDISDTAVDVFIYNTRKDSDGGAWRKRTQNTSWYNETLNTATRGARKEFPAVAVIVAESSQVTIYDGDDPDLPMWMVFNQGTQYQIYTNNNSLSSIQMLNGKLCWAGFRVGRIDFIKDASDALELTYYVKFTNPISGRNTANYSYETSAFSIINNTTNDVAMTVLPNAPIDSATGLPVPTIAVATAGGVSVISDTGSVYDITNSSSTYTASYHVSFDSKNNLWFHQGKTLLSYHGWVYVYSMPLSGDTAISINSQVATGQNPIALFQRHTGSGGSIQFRMDGGDSLIANTATGNDSGIGVFDLNTENHNASMAFQSTSDFNTGWMNGDIKLATLSDTDDTNATGPSVLTNYDLSSGDLTGFTLTSADSGGGIYANQNPIYVATNLVGIGNTGSVRQNVTVEAGKKYIVGYYCDTRSTSQYRLGIYFSHVGGSLTFDDTVGPGANKLYYWTSDYTGTTLLQFRGRGGGYGTFTNFIFDEVEEDRSVNGNGLQVFGTVTKSAVATGADLMAYSGFSTSNYLFQSYNSDLDFGTGDFSVMLWFNTPDKSVTGTLLHRGSNDIDDTSWATNAVTQIEFNTSNLYALVGTNNFGTNSGPNVPLTAINNNTWHHYAMVRRSGRIYAYLDGNYIDDAANTLTNTNSTGKVYIGERPYASRVFNGSLALYRISATPPSPAQIKKIYEDEKFLFQENAKATLYGSSDAVTALAYDDDTELLHAGTSAGRSVFQGLRRIDNTTDAVGAAISASNGMVAED